MVLYMLLDRTATVIAVCREVEEKVGGGESDVYFASFIPSSFSFTPQHLSGSKGRREKKGE